MIIGNKIMTNQGQQTSLFAVIQQHDEWGSQIQRLQEQVAKLEEQQSTSQ